MMTSRSLDIKAKGASNGPGNTSWDRLAEGRRRDDIAKPKSVLVAAQVKKEEERKTQERQEKMRDRTRTESIAVTTAAGPKIKLECSGTSPKLAPSAASASAGPSSAGAFGATGAAGPSAGMGARAPKKSKPAVPLFAETPNPRLERMKVPLDSPRAIDNYEISEGENSDEEHSRDRSGKHIPEWSKQYLQMLNGQVQQRVDPDSIFGAKVPCVVLEDIFLDEDYRRAGKERPRRTRGSSGEWSRDRLRVEEIGVYKRKMGHSRAWQAGATQRDDRRASPAALSIARSARPGVV